MKYFDFGEKDLNQITEYNITQYNMWDLQCNHNPAFYVYENLFCEDDCHYIKKLSKNIQVAPSQVMGQTNAEFSDIRKSMTCWLHPSDITWNIFEKIDYVVKQCNNLFQYDLSTLENLQLTEYDDEYQGMYGIHTDSSVHNTHSPGVVRKLSLSVQLSHPEEYEGGELKIYHSNTTEPFIAPKAIGTAVLFPSYHLHEVTPVTKGKRYSLVSWCLGPRFK